MIMERASLACKWFWRMAPPRLPAPPQKATLRAEALPPHSPGGREGDGCAGGIPLGIEQIQEFPFHVFCIAPIFDIPKI